MGHPAGESKDGPLESNFDRHLKVDSKTARSLPMQNYLPTRFETQRLVSEDNTRN
jgi:hypothetical protein